MIICKIYKSNYFRIRIVVFYQKTFIFKEIQIKMNELLVLYNERLDLLRINRPLGLPLSLKLFDLRIKLAISIISLSYDTNIFPYENDRIRQCYTKMVKLMESWYAFEALIKFTRPNIVRGEVKYNAISRDINSIAGCDDIFNDCHANLMQRCGNNNFLNDFSELNIIINNDNSLGRRLREDCSRLFTSLTNNVNLSKLEIMALIYAERNMYIHNGLTPFGNMNHNNRLFLLDLYTQYLCQYIFKLAIHLLSLRIYERLNN